MIKPLHDMVLVKPLPAEEKTASGLYIPDTAKEKPLKGIVIDLGEGRISTAGTLVPMTVKKGDLAIFGKHAGTETELEGEQHLLMREYDILAIEQAKGTNEELKKLLLS